MRLNTRRGPLGPPRLPLLVCTVSSQIFSVLFGSEYGTCGLWRLNWIALKYTLHSNNSNDNKWNRTIVLDLVLDQLLEHMQWDNNRWRFGNLHNFSMPSIMGVYLRRGHLVNSGHLYVRWRVTCNVTWCITWSLARRVWSRGVPFVSDCSAGTAVVLALSPEVGMWLTLTNKIT